MRAQAKTDRQAGRHGCDGLGWQLYTGRLCKRCNDGYYPWFGECLLCPDGFAWTAKNTLTVIYRYGIIWLLWIVVNRFLCETLMMADSLLNFAQMYVAWLFLRCMSHAFCVLCRMLSAALVCSGGST